MHRSSPFGFAALLVLSVAACGDEDDGGGSSLEGTYDITSNTVTSGGCEGSGVAVPGSVVLRVTRDEFFGQPIMQAFVCETEDACGGEDDFSDFTFVQRRGAQWVTEASTSSSSGDTSCLLGFNESTLQAVEGGVLVQETLSTGEFELAGDACDPDAVDSRRDQLTCDQIRRLEATSRE